VDRCELGGIVCFKIVLQQVHSLSMTSKRRLMKKAEFLMITGAANTSLLV
jgi:hypothetical protein